MTEIVQMSKGGKDFYPQTHTQAVLGLSEFVNGLVNADVDLTKYMTTDQVKSAISNAIKGLNPEMSNYLTKDETVKEVTSIVNKTIADSKPDLSGFQKVNDVQASIKSALANYLDSDGVKAEIANQIKANQPDLSGFQKAGDVQAAISTAIKGIKPTDLSNYPTKPEMTTAIASAKPDVSKFVTMAQVQSEIDKTKIDINKAGEVDAQKTIGDAIKKNMPVFITQQLSINTGAFTGNAYITKQGRLVTIQYSGMDANNNYTNFATLPDWAYPLHQVAGIVFTMDKNYHTYSAGALQISTSGSMTVQSSIGYGYAQFTVTYVTAS